MRIIETCPHCECDNLISDWHEEDGYEIVCWNCGRRIMLCTACASAEDNRNRYCDWHGHQCGEKMTAHCFRMKRMRVTNKDIWYAVQRDEDDNDWGYGAFSLEGAKLLAKRKGYKTIAKIIGTKADPICDGVYRLDENNHWNYER